MWSSKTVKQTDKLTLGAVLFLVALPGFGGLGNNAVADDKTEQAHQAAQVTQLERQNEAFRKVNQVNQFIADYAKRSLKGRWKAQSRQIASAIIETGARHGLDPLLILAMIENESRFDPEVVGTHGEIGLMQIKPDTAEWIAKKNRINWNGSDVLRDPVANIRLGAAYLSMLRTKYSSDKDLYLAAYNMGVKNLNRILSANTRPQIYPQRTSEHYTKIYFEFMNEKPGASNAGSFAGI